jgi:hypothetical protein
VQNNQLLCSYTTTLLCYLSFWTWKQSPAHTLNITFSNYMFTKLLKDNEVEVFFVTDLIISVYIQGQIHKKGGLHASYDWTKVVTIILLSYKSQWKQIENCYQLMVPLVLVHCGLDKKTYNGYWLNISTDNHVTKQKNNQKRNKVLGHKLTQPWGNSCADLFWLCWESTCNSVARNEWHIN